MTVSTDITGTFAALLAALLDAGSDVDFARDPSGGYHCFITTAQDVTVGSGPTPEAALRQAGGEPGAQLTVHQEELIRAHYGDGVDMDQVRAQLAAGLYEFDFEGMEQDAHTCGCGHHAAEHSNIESGECLADGCGCERLREVRAESEAAPPLWTYDGSQWRAQLPDGRTAVIERLAEGDDDGQGAAFLPRVYESAGDFATGPVCCGVLAAGAWAEQFAGTAE